MAIAPGATQETADGMSMEKIETIIDAMRHERYRFSPVQRTYIPKKNGKLRPLGLPTWSDKLVGEVMRLLLEAYYEPTFSDHSHGFRPGRGCHTALREVADHSCDAGILNTTGNGARRFQQDYRNMRNGTSCYRWSCYRESCYRSCRVVGRWRAAIVVWRVSRVIVRRCSVGDFDVARIIDKRDNHEKCDSSGENQTDD
jgi:hypothetical protein